MLGQTTQQVNEKVTCGKLNDISFLGLVQSMGYLGKIELFGLIKCVSVQGSLQSGRPYIYGSLLDHLVRTCRNVKKYVQLGTLAFQCCLAESTNISLFKGESWGARGQVERYLKSDGCTDNSCSLDSANVRHSPLLSKSSGVCSFNYREQITFAQEWRTVTTSLESQAFISRLGNHINFISLFVFLKNR